MIGDTPRASILVPVFNGEDSIVRAVDSARSQTMEKIEILVIDDGSTDATRVRVAEIADLDSRVRLLPMAENAGPGAARAHGLASARGDWIAILDADDTMVPDRLARLIAFAESRGLDAVSDNLELLDPGIGRIVGRAFPLAPDRTLDIDVTTFLNNTRPGARVNLGWMQPVVRRAFLQEHGVSWPALRHAEDMVFTLRLLGAGARMTLLGDAGYIYTQRRGTRSGTRSSVSRTRRSVAEQHRALELARVEGRTMGFGDEAMARLGRMDAEVTATAHALDLIDAFADRSPLPALLAMTGLIRTPVALARVLHARYITGRAFR